MPAYEFKIFPHNREPFNGPDWHLAVLGDVVKPAVSGSRDKAAWCFANIYASEFGGPLDGDAKQCEIEESFLLQPPESAPIVRLVKFCFFEDGAALGQAIEAEMNRAGCRGKLLPYSYVQELGADRFLGGARTPDRRQERAEMVARYLDALFRIQLHALDNPQGTWAYEDNDFVDENPGRSSFESIIHMGCNATEVRLPICENSGLSSAEVAHWIYAPKKKVGNPPQLELATGWKLHLIRG